MPDLRPSGAQDVLNPPGNTPYLNVWFDASGVRLRFNACKLTTYYSIVAIGPTNLRRFTITRMSMRLEYHSSATFPRRHVRTHDLPGRPTWPFGRPGAPDLGIPHAYAYQFGGNYWYVPRFGEVAWSTDDGDTLGNQGAQLILDSSGAIRRDSNHVKSLLYGGTATRFLVQTLLANDFIDSLSDTKAVDYLISRLARNTMSGSFQQDVPWTRAPVDPPPIDPVPEPDPPSGGLELPDPDVPGDDEDGDDDSSNPDNPYYGGSPNWPSADVGTPAHELVTIPTQDTLKVVVRRG